MMIGKVDSDREVKDRNSMQRGRVKSDGTVVDRSNMTIGNAKGFSVIYPAVFFFFKFSEIDKWKSEHYGLNAPDHVLHMYGLTSSWFDED
jgi:hypothetical protein